MLVIAKHLLGLMFTITPSIMPFLSLFLLIFWFAGFHFSSLHPGLVCLYDGHALSYQVLPWTSPDPQFSLM